MNTNEFSVIIRNARESQNMTIKTLAEKTGLGFRSIQYWERGKMSITIDNADRLLKTLGIEITIGGQNK